MVFKVKRYKAGLVKSPYGKKYMWQLEKNVDNLSPDIYEYDEVEAKNKQEAVDKLNVKHQKEYGNSLRKKPFGWNEGWW
jgi:hypothetical protein